MGPPPRSLAVEANDCFMVRVQHGSNRIQGCGAMLRAQWADSPRVVPTESLTYKSPYKELWNGPPLRSGSFKLPMQQEERVEAMQIKILGIDLGKNLCSLAGLDGSGQVVVRGRVRRENLLKVGS